ncbi:MarR family winged helix-turn-helix transcriptional regulator [Methanobrevibacter sp.]|uniref:MarR family winged helix-turn-helix transcriptional regulator n=1 Tax=Methanobrevibacter sp. TaxID=66852 RepID=UPI002E7A204A|nr:MarR family transcriptional regulator [Methanobrevibacter sp.]MEE0025927.1 MarR family transcriptional regulator [Methanobrevibacter sp.]
MNEILFHKLYFINEIFEQKIKAQQKKMNNISRGQGRVLAILKKKDNISTKNLAIILGISVSALNSLLTKLEKNGYIVKESSMEDKRVLLVKLTEKGRNFEIKPSVDYSLFDCLDNTQKQEFDKYLNNIINELLNDIKKDNPEKFEKTAQKRNNLIKELFDNDKDNMFWFNMIKE